jgi:hypothetical protein
MDVEKIPHMGEPSQGRASMRERLHKGGERGERQAKGLLCGALRERERGEAPLYMGQWKVPSRVEGADAVPNPWSSSPRETIAASHQPYGAPSHGKPSGARDAIYMDPKEVHAARQGVGCLPTLLGL